MLDDFREWLSDNLRYILLGLAVILIVVIGFCVVRLITGGSSDRGQKEQINKTTESEMITEAAVVAATEAPAQQETAAAGTSSLIKDDTAILTLVKKYYTAAAEKDITTLETIVDPWNDDVKENVLQNDIIESYNTISTYSKKGPVDNSYIVYAYYEGKVANIETLVPSLSMLYLTTNAEGNLMVSDRNASQEVAEYIAAVSSDSDVQALIADVDAQCERAKEADPALKEFMASLTAGAAPEEESGETDVPAEASGDMIVTVEVLNIRQEPNTSSAIMGVATTGTTLTVIEMAEDGWCKINYNSSVGIIEGYVKLEYLAAPETAGDTANTDGTVNTGDGAV